MIKNAGGLFSPADEESEQQLLKLKNCDHYSIDIKLNHNYKLLQKIQCFYDFCCQHYYGDIEAHKDNIKRNHVIYVLKCTAGYFDQEYDRDGNAFMVKARSISYEKMSHEDRCDYYKRLTQAALDGVFDRTNDNNVINQVIDWF